MEKRRISDKNGVSQIRVGINPLNTHEWSPIWTMRSAAPLLQSTSKFAMLLYEYLASRRHSQLPQLPKDVVKPGQFSMQSHGQLKADPPSRFHPGEMVHSHVTKDVDLGLSVSWPVPTGHTQHRTPAPASTFKDCMSSTDI